MTCTSTRTLLFVSGGVEAVPGIRLARRLGLRVVVSDMDPEAPGFALADHCILASTYDVEATVAAARRFHREVRPIDGVICVASDVPVTVARVAAELGLPGIPVESARRAADKLAMKERFAADGVPVPWFRPVESPGRLGEIVARRGLPLVLKPCDSRGSRGVLLLREGISLDRAFEISMAHSRSRRLLVEEYLPGPQVSTESMILDGVAFTSGLSDRNYELLETHAPYFIENGGELPSRLPAGTRRAIEDLVERGARSLGISRGVVKGDVVVCGGEPRLIEMAARLSGGFFCTHEIPLATGVRFVEAAIRLALGDPVEPRDLRPCWCRGVALRRLFPKPGRIVRIEGADEVRSLPGVAELVLTRTCGDRVPVPTDSTASAGMVITVAESREAAVARAEEAVRRIRVETVAA